MRRITLTHAFLIASAFFSASVGVRAQEPAHEPSMLFFAVLTKAGSPGCALGV